MSYVRCKWCRKRRTLRMPVSHYFKLPVCKGYGCRAKQKRLGRRQEYYVDKYRERFERGQCAPKTCWPGKGGCNFYHFPHRRGSGLCLHNPNHIERDQ